MATETLTLLFPAGILIVAACLFLFVGHRHRERGTLWSRLCLLAFCTAGGIHAAIVTNPETTLDPLSRISHGLLLGTGLAFAAMKASGSGASRRAAECMAMLMFSIAGAMIVVRADDLVLLMTGLQLVNLPLGVLLFLSGRNERSVEAVLKFTLTGFLSTVLVIYGFVLLYGLSSATHFVEIGRLLQSAGRMQSLGVAAVILIFTGLGIQIAVVPFHFPLVDISDDVDAWTAGLVCAIPRIAAAAALIRLCRTALPAYADAGVPVLLILSVVTVGGGNLVALSQTRVRRMFTSLWIAQAGIFLLCLAAVLWWAGATSLPVASVDAARADKTPVPASLQRNRPIQWNSGTRHADAIRLRTAEAATMFHICTSTIAITGLFAALVYLAGEKRPVGSERPIDYVDELTGLVRAHPLIAVTVAIFLLSLAGIPPLLGFWSYLAACITAIGVHTETETSLIIFHKGFLIAAGIVVFGGMMTARTGLRLIGVMFLEAPLAKPRSCSAWMAQLVTAGAAALIVIAGCLPHLLFAWLWRR